MTTSQSLSADSVSDAGWRRVVGTVGGVFLGLVLLVAAWGKLLDPMAFTEQIRTEGLDILLSAYAVALIALVLEVALGLALVLDLRKPWVLWPSAALVAFFLFLTGRTYWLWSRGELEATSSCGCFGNLLQRTPAEAFWQDLALMVPALLLAFLGRPRGRLFPPFRTALVAVGAAAALVFAIQAPELPLDDLATRLSPGVETADLCVGADADRVCFPSIVPELSEGRHVVILTELDDEAFTGAVPRLNGLATGGGPRPWVVTTATPEELNAFYWQRGPAFEIRDAPEPLLRPLYRRLPRSFEVVDGTVTATWSGLPPLEEPADDQPAAATPSSPAQGA